MTTITVLPTPPSRDDPATFPTRSNDFVAALPTFGSQVNAVAGEVNAAAAAAAASAATATTKASDAADMAAIATGIANYLGEWSTLTGALSIPASVSHGGAFYTLKSNAPDVTAITPGVSSQWLLIGATALFRLPIMQANAGYTPASVLETVGSAVEYDTALGNGPSYGAYTGSLYVMSSGAATDKVATSADAETWTLRTMPSSAVWHALGVDGAVLLALVQNSTTVAKSTDHGVTWSAAAALPAATEGYCAPMMVGGVWVVFRLNATTDYYTSADAAAWTSRTFPTALNSSADVRLLAGGVLWVRAAGSSTAYTTTDGISWTSRTLPAAFNNNAVYPDGSLQGVASGSYAVQRTADGINWSTSGAALTREAGSLPALVNGVYCMQSTNVYTYAGGVWMPRTGGAITGITVAYQFSASSMRNGGVLNGRYIQLKTGGRLAIVKADLSIKGLFTKD